MILQPILSIRATVRPRAVPAFTQDALERIRLYSKHHCIETLGRPFVTTHPSADPGLIDVEAGWPTRRHCPGSGDINAGELPVRRPKLRDML